MPATEHDSTQNATLAGREECTIERPIGNIDIRSRLLRMEIGFSSLVARSVQHGHSFLCWRGHQFRHAAPDADEQCEFCYQPEGWGKAYRFLALRYQKQDPLSPEREQYQVFDSPQYIYRVFVTNMKRPIDLLMWFYNQRAGAENLIKEANNDAGLAAHPSRRWATNCVHFQLAMLAYNLNCWLLLFQREETAKVAELKHTTLAIARLRFLFLAAKVWRHAGRVGVSYSDQYAERGLFHRLMDRLRNIAPGEASFAPVLLTPLRS